jgi:hypothetical protein
VNTQWQTSRILLSLLLAAGVITCLFGLFLPASASLLPPTSTPTATITSTPSPTRTPTPTITPLPANLITPGVAKFGGYTAYWRRELWEQAIGKPFRIEDFEQEGTAHGSIALPYLTGNKFLLSGKSYAELIDSVQLLPDGTYLHFRDWEQGLTLKFPDETAVTAFAFDYTTPELWVLTYNDVELGLPSGTYQFVGIILYEDTTNEFTLSSSADVQGGLSMDNLSYIP